MPTRTSRTAAARRSVQASRAKKVKASKRVEPTLGRRIGLLYGLTGLFGVVVVGLMLARPKPLQANEESAPAVTLLATRSVGGADPLDAALGTGTALPGHWTGVTVLRLTTPQARAAHAHFKVVLESETSDTPQVVVGPEWLAQSAMPGDPTGQFVLVVAVDDHEREIRDEATVISLVDRLCDRLRIDRARVQWS